MSVETSTVPTPLREPTCTVWTTFVNQKDTTMNLFSVIVHAFGTPRLRRVFIPGKLDKFDVNEVLEMIFKFGQNDFQPVKGCPSVSVGDFILLPNDDVYVVKDFGFEKLERLV